METDPNVWIGVLRRSHHQLRSLVEPLDSDQLRSQAYPSEWSIAQVLSHFGSGAEVFELLLQAGLTGGPMPDLEVMQPIWATWNAKSPDAQAADGLESDDALIKRLEALPPEDVKRFQMSMFGMELDLAGLTRLRLGEHSLHSWDIAVALDPTATVNPEAVDLMVDGLDGMASRGVNPSGQPLRLRVNATDPARSFLLEAGEAVSLTPGTANSVDAELSIPAEALMRLVAGRLDAAHTPAVTIQGTDLDHLRAMFPGL